MRLQIGLRDVTVGRDHHLIGPRQEIRKVRLRAGTVHALLPLREQDAVQRGILLARLGRGVGADIRLDVGFIATDAIDMDVDAQPVDQPLVIQLRAAGAGRRSCRPSG